MAQKFLHKIVALVLCFSFIISMSCFFSVSAAEASGVVSVSVLNVRTGPGRDYDQLVYNGANVQLLSGDDVTVLDTVKSTSDEVYTSWHKIKFTYSGKELTGYVYEQSIKIYTMPDGVPDEYKSYIEEILKVHPNWKFVFYDTGIEWNSLFGADAQGYVGRSLIAKSYPLSYRSTASGCYNWRTDAYIMQDAGGWYQANTKTIAYYMDPRNFLNINDVFMFESLSYDKATQTLDGVEKILDGSFMDGVKIKDTAGHSLTYAQAYIKAAEQTKVSPYHLASRTIQEVGKAGSNSVSGKKPGYEGLYNFYNIGASQGSDPIANGLRYASGVTSSEANKKKYMLPWNSQYKAIVGGAIWIGNGYINSKYKQNTMYFQKFNTSGGNFGHQYMGNILAPKYEAQTIRKTYTELGILDKSFTFIIPYYRNMPKAACQLPAKNNYNPNNWLKALYAINDSTGKDLIEGFDGAQTTWNLGNVNAKTFTVKATPVNSKATVSGTGKIKLKDGKNTIKVVVTAENGSKKTYSITLNANVPQEPPQQIKLGDVDNDGKITITDALLIFKHKSGEKTLSADGQKAADTNKNGTVDISDALLIFKYKSGEIASF